MEQLRLFQPEELAANPAEADEATPLAPRFPRAEVAAAFEAFEPHLKKLRAERLNGSYEWWRSRWSEFVNHQGGDEKAVWERKSRLYSLFDEVWEHYECELTEQKFKCRLPKPKLRTARLSNYATNRNRRAAAKFEK
jgi:hypothetical protein